MTQQRASATSYDLLRSCVDILETLQPMLQSTQTKKNMDMLVLAVQTVNTISSMIQGPHEANQKALLSTTFLSTVNRLLAGVVYVAEQPTGPSVAMATLTRAQEAFGRSESVQPRIHYSNGPGQAGKMSLFRKASLKMGFSTRDITGAFSSGMMKAGKLMERRNDSNSVSGTARDACVYLDSESDLSCHDVYSRRPPCFSPLPSLTPSPGSKAPSAGRPVTRTAPSTKTTWWAPA